MARVERLVIVVDADRERPEWEAFTQRRCAEVTDGQRIDDPYWRSGSSSGTFFDNRPMTPEARAAEKREHTIQTIREGGKHVGARSLDSMVSALRQAGVDTTADELRGLPIAVEFTDAADARMQDAAAGRLDRSIPAPPLWSRAAGVGFWIVLGTIFPSLNRYRAWKRQSRRGRALSFLADWLVGAAVKGRRRSSR